MKGDKENLDLVPVEATDNFYLKMFSAVGTEYFMVEREAHLRARERLAFVDGKRVPYIVKMSVYAANVDRSKGLLEDDFKRGFVQADVIVFESVEQKKVFREEGYLVFNKR